MAQVPGILVLLIGWTFPPSEAPSVFQASPRPSPTRISQHRIPVLRGDTWWGVSLEPPQKPCPQERFDGWKTKFTRVFVDRVRWRWNYSNVSSPQEDLYTHKWLMRMGRMIFICIFCWSKQCISMISMKTSTQKPWKWWDLVQRNFRFQRLGDLGCPSMLVYWGQRQNVKIKLPQAINSTSSAYVIQI